LTMLRCREISKLVSESMERKLDPEVAKGVDVERLEMDEKGFRFLLNEDAMATEKTAEGIRKFAADMGRLEDLVRAGI
jgi:transaldolase